MILILLTCVLIEWQQIQAAIEEGCQRSHLKQYMETLRKYSNIPRKKPKFEVWFFATLPRHSACWPRITRLLSVLFLGRIS